MPIADPAGWNDADSATNGTWFHMVQTNSAMARIRLGYGSAYVDDLTVRTALPATYGFGMGTVFKFR